MDAISDSFFKISCNLQAKRLKWVDEGFNMLVFSDNNLLQFDNQREDSIRRELADADRSLGDCCSHKSGISQVD